MKVNKLYFGVALLFAMALWGCSSDDDTWFPSYGRWSIDNRTTHNFDVILDFMSYDDNDVLYVRKSLVANVQANTLSHITLPYASDSRQPDTDFYYYQEYAQIDIYRDEYPIIITFEFPNGIRHTFTGDRIACDVRDANNWVVTRPKTHYSDHVYTFTQEDYDEIMSLYE